MAGFSSGGDVKVSGSAPDVVFCLKASSTGKELKTYTVSAATADSFEAGIRAEEPRLREEAGETAPLTLIRISRCF